MEATLKVALRPFTVPNFVLVETVPGKREDGVQDGPKCRLEDLDSLTLEALCDEFRDAVFVKAGKGRPAQCASLR